MRRGIAMKHICFLFLVLLYGDAIASLTPECNCVEQVGSEYKAWFGFNNDGSAPVLKAVGTDNKLFGGGLNNTNGDLGQLRVFKPGTFKKAFSVKFDGSTLSWTLNGKTVTASNTTTQCTQGKVPSRPQPSYVRVKTYNDDGNPAQITTSYADGLGREFETQLDLNGINGYDVLIRGGTFDEQGRPNRTYKSFPAVTDGGYIGSTDLDKMAKEYFSTTGPGEDAEGYPFSEVSYYADPLSRKSMTGGAGKPYSLDESSGHPVRYWYFTSKCSGNSDYDADGFLTCNALKKLIAVTPVLPSEVTEPATHILNVVCDADGNFTQELINPVYGKTEMTWANSKTLDNPEIIKTINVFNIQGNLKSVIPPGSNLISPSEYFYNTLGQLTKKINSDGTIERYEYYTTGKQKRRSYKDHSDAVVIRDVFYEYDDFDRIVSIYTIVNGKKIPKIAYYYDFVENVPLQYMGDLRCMVSVHVLENLKGKVVATISFGEIGANPLEVESRNRVVELFSYDGEGRVAKKFIQVPGIYLHEIRYEYDLQGKVRKESILNGDEAVIAKKYEYDELSRLTRIINEKTSPPEIIASYHYDDRSLLTYRQLLTDNSYTEQNEYTLQDNLKSFTGVIGNVFSETLDYSSHFNGNISGSAFTYQTPTPVTLQNQYLYDGINRLKSVNSITGSVPTQVCNYEYDVAGRFKNKKENTSTQSNYQYYSGNIDGTQKYTCRLRKVGSGDDRFIYNQFGSMVVDKSKNLVIQYDYRDLPVFFRFYSALPSGITADQWGTVLIDDDEYKGVKGAAFNDKDINDYMSYIVKKTKSTASEIRLQSVVMMLYDAAGQRVLKNSIN